MASRKPVIHARDHLPGGADPIPGIGSGSIDLYGYGSLSLAITNPGGLLAWYRFAEAGPTGDALDSSGNSRTLTYFENTSPVNADGETWSTANEVIRVAGAHSELGPGDDGVAFFQYDQAHNPGGDEGTWTSKTYPGAGFVRTDSALADWGTSVKTALGFFKVPSGGHKVITQTLVGSRSWNSSETGSQGWAVQFIPNTGVLQWVGGAFGPGGLIPAGALTFDQWHLWAVTYDSTTHIWTLYLDGEPAATLTSSTMPNDNGGIMVGNDRGTYGNFPENASADAFYHGYQDELALYSVTLSLDDIQAIWAARGSGTGFGPTTTSITVGSGATPFALSSKVGDANAPANEVAASDGAGGTYWMDIGGLTWHLGSGDPSDTLGSDGDGYIDGDTGEVWTKVSGGWVDSGYALTGPAGPAGPAGSTPARKQIFSWGGTVPTSLGLATVWEVPYDTDGTSFALTIQRATARIEIPGAGDTTFSVLKSAGGDAAFSSSPSTVSTVTVAAGHYRQIATGIGFAINSGDLLALDFSAVGAAGAPFTVQVEATA